MTSLFKKESPIKILLIKFRNIGDVLLATALVENLKLNFPNSSIDFALNANCIDMMSLNPNINQIFSYDRSTIKKQSLFSKLRSEFGFIKNITQNNYDVVINLTEGDRGSLIALFSQAKIKLGYKPRKGLLKQLKIYDQIGEENQDIHTIEKDLQFIALLDQEIINKKASIYWSKSNESTIDKYLEKHHINQFVHVHPVSRWMFKCWEDERMAQVIDYLEIEKDLRVVITASNEAKETSRVNDILALCQSSPLNLTGQLNLKDLAYLSSKAQFFFGIDSAPMHMAAAVNTAVVTLFGASNPIFWGPWDNNKWGNDKCDGDKTSHSYSLENGHQVNGKHRLTFDSDHTIFYRDSVKKSRGMVNIEKEPVLSQLDDVTYR